MSPIIRNGKATRATAIHGVVDSQATERYQAVDFPVQWGRPSRVGIFLARHSGGILLTVGTLLFGAAVIAAVLGKHL